MRVPVASCAVRCNELLTLAQSTDTQIGIYRGLSYIRYNGHSGHNRSMDYSFGSGLI